MKKIKLLLAITLLTGLFTVDINNNIKAEESDAKVKVDETNNKGDETVIEQDVPKYTYDEEGNITSEISDEELEASMDKSRISRSAREYSLGYIDFVGYSSQVINVYQSAVSTSAYTYFNTGSGERIASLGEVNGRIKIAINGFVGYIDKTAYITSAPFRPAATLDSSYSEYYTVNTAGDLVYTYCYYETLTSIIAGKAPDFFQAGVKYYSLDGIYFYTNRTTMLSNYSADNFSGAMNVNNPFYNYYQYLPFRSKTNLNATDFKRYLSSRISGSSLSSSVMNNDSVINEFFNSQNNLGVNAALEYSMAMLESGYGTSQIAREKYNLFGWGAVDSGPYAGAFKFSSVEQGVNYHFKNAVSSGYLDVVSDFRYYGGSVGNKNNGLNVKYASDPYWGMKIAGLYYSMDKQAGYKDYNYYKLAIQTQPATNVTYNGAYAYTAKNMYSNINVKNLSYVVVGDNGSTVSLMSDIGVCNAGDSINNININQSTLQLYTTNYSCPSTKVHFGAQYKFNEDIVQMAKSSVVFAGGSAMNQPSGGGVVVPPSGDVVVVGDMTYVLKQNSDQISYAYKKDVSQNIINYYEYYTGATVANASSNIQYQFNINPSNGYIINAVGYNKNSTTPINYYEYVPGTMYSRTGSHGGQTKYTFYINGQYLDKAYGFSNGIITNVYEYAPNTVYNQNGSHSIRLTDIYDIASNGNITSATGYSNGIITSYSEFYPNTKYAQKSNVLYKFTVNPNSTIRYASAYNIGSSVPTTYYEYIPGTRYSKTGSHGFGTQYIFEMSGTKLNKAFGLSNGAITNVYEYASGTTYGLNGEHGSKVSSVYYLNPNGSIIFSQEHNSGRIVSYSEYYPGTTYANRSRIQNRFYINELGNITYADGFNTSGQVVNKYEYFGGSKFGAHASRIRYVFYTSPYSDELIVAYEVNSSWKRIYEVKYLPNTYYNPNGSHGSRIFSVNRV